MRIAVWHNLPSGGGKRALYNHIKALKTRGHYLESWTTDLASQDYLPLSEIIPEHVEPIKDSLKKINKIKSSIKRFRKTTDLLKNHCKNCIKDIEAGKFDILFANSCSLTYMPFIGIYSKIPSVVFLGEPNRKLYEASESGNIWQFPSYQPDIRGINRYRRDFLRTCLHRMQVAEEINSAKSYNKVLVNSLFSRESIKRAYGINSTVCYLGIDESSFNVKGDVVKEPYIVGLGRISPAKNVETAIRVVSKIAKEQRPSLKWISNGFDADYFDSILSLAESLDVNFKPLINIDDKELLEVLSKASVMIYTSHLEPFGLAPIEANFSGTFVVAIAEGGVRETIKPPLNGFLINGLNYGEMARTIMPLISNLKHASEMGKKAREHALKFWNWNQMADNIENELISVVDEKKAGYHNSSI